MMDAVLSCHAHSCTQHIGRQAAACSRPPASPNIRKYAILRDVGLGSRDAVGGSRQTGRGIGSREVASCTYRHCANLRRNCGKRPEAHPR